MSTTVASIRRAVATGKITSAQASLLLAYCRASNLSQSLSIKSFVRSLKKAVM